MYHKWVSLNPSQDGGVACTDLETTGYKLRIHISKALKTHSKAIQRALAGYNLAAAALDPPRPKLTWAQIVEYTTIAEFALLHSGARNDIRNLFWADAHNRQATVCHLKLLCTQEEITHLNIEIKRVATWIVHEGDELDQAIAQAPADSGITCALKAFAANRKCVNASLQRTLEQIYNLEGFSGERSIGIRADVAETRAYGGDASEASDAMSNSTDKEDDLLGDIFDGIVQLSLD